MAQEIASLKIFYEDGSDVDQDTIIFFGDTLALCPASFDSAGNFIEYVQASWNIYYFFDNLPKKQSQTEGCIDFIFSIDIPTNFIIVAHYNNFTDTSGVIIVKDPDTITPDYIQIRSAPDGTGDEVNTFIIHTGQEITLYAAGYDSSDNFIQNQVVEWSTTGTLDPVSVVDTALVFAPINDPCMSPALGTIVAKTENLSYETGIIQVMRCGVCYIEIQCAPYGGSSENDCFPDYEDTLTVLIGDSLSLWAAAYDNGNNYMYDMELDSVDFEFTSTLNLENWVFNEIGQGRIIATDIDTSGVYIVEEPTGVIDDKIIKSGFYLEKAYPNPFNPNTTIKFHLPNSEHVRLEVYNNIGQKIKTLVDREMNAGEYIVEFNAESLSSGIYLYKIEAGEFQDVKKMILIK
jgi:hypothetical protein